MRRLKKLKLIRWMSVLLVLSLVFGGLIGLNQYTGANDESGGVWYDLPKEHLSGAAEKLRDVQWQLTQNGVPIAEDAFLEPDKDFRMVLKFRVPVKGDINANKIPGLTEADIINKGDVGTIVLFKGIQMKESITGMLKTEDLFHVANWTIRGESDSTVIDLNFTGDDEVFTVKNSVFANINGMMSLEMFNDIVGTEEQEIEVLGRKFKVQPKQSMNKTGKLDKKNFQIDWTVELGGNVKDHVFQDDLTNVGEYVENSFKVNDQPVDSVVYDSDKKLLRYAFTENLPGKKIVTFSTKLTQEELFLRKEPSSNYPLKKKIKHNFFITMRKSFPLKQQ